MKKGSFYVSRKDKEDKVYFEKVEGYIDRVTLLSGKEIMVGYDHRVKSAKNNHWCATHIESGCLICSGDKKKQTQEKVMNYSEAIENALKLDFVQIQKEKLNKFLEEQNNK